jgi:hypothetical protein
MTTACTYTYSKTADFIQQTASTVCEVVNAVFTASTYISIFNAVFAKSNFKEQDKEDTKQDLFLYLFDQPDKVVDLYNKGQLRFFFASICKRQLHSNKSKLFGRYISRQQGECQLFEDNEEVSNEEMNETSHTSHFIDLDQLIDNRDRFNYVIGKINQHINTSKQLKRNLTIYLLYYVDDLTIKQISEKTTISQSLVYKYLKQAREWVTKNIDPNLFA